MTMDISKGLIRKDKFGEKIKLNWFAYEMSLSFFSSIEGRMMNNLEKKGYSPKDLADFCVHMGRSVRDMALEHLERNGKHVEISYEPIQMFFPRLKDRQVDRMIDIMMKAYDDLLAGCEVCPTRCLSERYQVCTMFDDKLYE